MCELLGMSANVPTDICFSFTGLVQRGGITGPHTDGWGIAFYERRGCRCFHDADASAHSTLGKVVRRYPIKSHIVISHIRQANRGRVCLENTHPFQRELWGRYWTFAHNGQLKGIKKLDLAHYRPVGTTDSEYAFCWILDQIRSHYPRPPARRPALWKLIAHLCQQLGRLGVFNILLTDSSYLYCYCSSSLSWITRRAPFGRARLVDTELAVDFEQETTPTDVVTVVATRPLTDQEQWQEMAAGECRVFQHGESVFSLSPPQLTKAG